MLFIDTPDCGTNVVTPEPISIKLYLYPTGIETEEFSGTVRFIEDVVDNKIVLLTSRGSSVKEDVFVVTTALFKIACCRSNCSSTEFHSIPSPAKRD